VYIGKWGDEDIPPCALLMKLVVAARQFDVDSMKVSMFELSGHAKSEASIVTEGVKCCLELLMNKQQRLPNAPAAELLMSVRTAVSILSQLPMEANQTANALGSSTPMCPALVQVCACLLDQVSPSFHVTTYCARTDDAVLILCITMSETNVFHYSESCLLSLCLGIHLANAIHVCNCACIIWHAISYAARADAEY
jgi:hypothetical protein